MKAGQKALLSLGSIGALLLFVAVGSAPAPKGPAHPVVATVVNVYVAGARFPHMVIVAHAPGAIDARGVFREGDDENCRVGDEVDGKLTGITLVVVPYTCRRPANIGRSREESAPGRTRT